MAVEFARDDISRLATDDEDPPDSSHLATKFDSLHRHVRANFENERWFQSFIWSGDPGSPYVGPPESERSEYVWFGLAHETYRSLGKPSGGLQFEFGIDVGSNRGFFDRSVICGLYFGPWVSDPQRSDVADRLGEHSTAIAEFLADRQPYVLATTDETWPELSHDSIADRADVLVDGFTLTADLEVEDLYAVDDITELVCRSFRETLPLYCKLAGVDGPALTPTAKSRDVTGGGVGGLITDASATDSADVEPTIESIDAHSSILDPDDIRKSLDSLTERGASRSEAMEYVRRYAIDMERDEGLYTVTGLGPVAGYALAQGGITTLGELATSSLDDLRAIDGLRDAQAKTILTNAREEDGSSPPADATHDQSPADTGSGQASASGDLANGTQETASTSATAAETSQSESGREPPVERFDGREIAANKLSEYYESLRSVRKVVSTVLQLRGTNVEPDDLTEPLVQYYVLLDACIGHGDLEHEFVSYGQQHRDRLPFSIRDYRQVFGDGEWVTEYHAIGVEQYRDETQIWLAEHTGLEDTHRFVRPLPPGGEHPLPESVSSFDDLRCAISVLRQFPAYPPLPTEVGATDRTVPIGELYSEFFAEVDDEQVVDIESLSEPGQASGDPITGPVADATPSSKADAESVLLDYGKLTHLFKRVNPPSRSPVHRPLPTFTLDWYRASSPTFDDLEALAKRGADESVSTFRARLRDMIHRRFLRDRWNYDYITVFPGHEAGSLSPQLVELAKDAVVETSIVYTPMLERTETTDRQRGKSREERAAVARDPDATLRARTKLDGETVILFDDVCTSGSSLLAGAYLLREAGAGRVVGLTLGFTPGGDDSRTKEIKQPDAFASEIIAGLER